MCLIVVCPPRYILDGDREQLRSIRSELAALKTHTLGDGAGGQPYRPQTYEPVEYSALSHSAPQRDRGTQNNAQRRPNPSADNANEASSEHKTASPARAVAAAVDREQRQAQRREAEEKLAHMRRRLQELADTGLYGAGDAVMGKLRRGIQLQESALRSLSNNSGGDSE